MTTEETPGWVDQPVPRPYFDHSACGHARSGPEGKKARAICRRERAAALREKLSRQQQGEEA